MTFISSRLTRVCAGAAVILAIGLSSANAQVVVVVNGAPITNFDIDQRQKILSSGQKPVPRDVALKDLIDDQLKLSRAKVYSFEIPDKDIDEQYASMARRQRMTVEQFNEFLKRAGITPAALKARLKAQITWTQLVRGKFSSTLQINDSDINQAMQARGGDEKATVGYIYTLYPIMFVVPKGSPETFIAQKGREAENLRNRFQSCQEGLALARGLRDVAVREPISRSSADLTPQLRELLGSMEVGKVTVPELTAQGLQMFALCDKKASNADTPEKKQVRDEIFSKRFESESAKYLEEIRRGAMIEYK